MNWELLTKGAGAAFVAFDYVLIGVLGWLLVRLTFKKGPPKGLTGLHRALDLGVALCPFMGLAGTVWEISGTLLQMGDGVTGVALAGPLGSALRYTFHGIIAASLCLVGSTLTASWLTQEKS